MALIPSKIQIEGGEVRNFYEAYGFIYMDADERTAPDEKEDAASSYAEESGEHRDGRTVYAPFDYTARFLVEAPNKDLANVNARINAFNRAIRERAEGSDVMRKREIAFYNLHNRVKIVGYPELIAVPTEVWHSGSYGATDYAEVELKIRVSDPTKCDFELFYGDGTNLLKNTAFDGLAHWELLSGPHITTADSETTSDGRNSLKIDNGESGWGSVRQTVSLAPGDYTLSTWWKCDDPDTFDMAVVEVRGFDAGGGRVWTKPFNAGQPTKEFRQATGYVTLTAADLSQAQTVDVYFGSRSTGIVWYNSPLLYAGRVSNPAWSANPGDNETD